MTQNLKISQIKPNTGQIEGLPSNPRVIKDEKFKELKQSLEENPEMLALRELLVYPIDGDKYVIIGGNMRYRAAVDLGYKELPCKIIPKGTPVENLKAYTIKDNNGYGEWDWDMLANEWDTEELEDWGVDLPVWEAEDENEEVEEDICPEVDEGEPTTKLGDIWKLGEHRLICGDSTKFETYKALMGEADADCIITDPPYNVDYEAKEKSLIKSRPNARVVQGVETNIANDKMTSVQFRDFLKGVFGAMANILRKGGAFYVWYSDRESINFNSSLIEQGLQVKTTLIWVKNQIILGKQDYQWQHEPCLYGWKKGASHYFIDDRTNSTVFEDKVEINKLTKDEMKAMLKEIFSDKMSTSVIHEDKPIRNEEHPTMKPIKLIARLVRNSTKKTETVLDPFGGSGSTLIACEQLNRKCCTIELDPKYCDVIVKRWENLTGEKAELLK